MIEVLGKDKKEYAALFENCEDSCIITAIEDWGGKLWIDSEEKTECALIIVGGYAFLAGNPKSENALGMVSFVDTRFEEGFNIRCVEAGFVPLVEKEYLGRINKYTRFATKRSFEHMDFNALEAKVNSLSGEFELVSLDKKLFGFCKSSDWADSFVISFSDYKEWEKLGFGVMILKDGEPVAGSSSYSAYPGGIEVEIITRSDYQGRGFAQITGAALLLECRKRGILASWDAAHEQSLRLAQKLGFEFLYKYDCYNISKKTP